MQSVIILNDTFYPFVKTWVPRQVVSPYKPELSGSETSSSDFATPIARLHQTPTCSTSKTLQELSDIASSDTAPLLSTAALMNTDENGMIDTHIFSAHATATAYNNKVCLKFIFYH